MKIQIISILDDVFSGLDHWDCNEECGHKVCLVEWRDHVADQILALIKEAGYVKLAGDQNETEICVTHSPIGND